MSKEKLLSMLQNKGHAVDHSKDQSVEKVTEPNPYSQADLSDFITKVGFPIEQNPDLTGAAESLNKKSKVLDTEEKQPLSPDHLSLLHQHLAAKGRLPKPPEMSKLPEAKVESSSENKQLSMKAMRNLIAKYKGKK
jgi:hypothetical protein